MKQVGVAIASPPLGSQGIEGIPIEIKVVLQMPSLKITTLDLYIKFYCKLQA